MPTMTEVGRAHGWVRRPTVTARNLSVCVEGWAEGVPGCMVSALL